MMRSDVKQQMGTLLLRRSCAGLIIAVAMASCALESDDVGFDDEAVGDIDTEDDRLGLWTGVQAPPYAAAAWGLSRRDFELKPDASGDITLVAELRWRGYAAGAVSPQLTFGLVTDEGESTLLQIFESRGALHTRFDLEMSNALVAGAWYRVVLTIADAPGRPVQARIFGEDGAEVWRSCAGGASCPSAPIDAESLETLRLSVSIYDARNGKGHIELKDLSLVPNP